MSQDYTKKVSLSGTVVGNLDFPDNIKARFGTGLDGEIYSDGTDWKFNSLAGADLDVYSDNDLSVESSNNLDLISGNDFKIDIGNFLNVFNAGAKGLVIGFSLPTAFTNASGAGATTYYRAESAKVGSGATGGGFSFACGVGDGAANPGCVSVTVGGFFCPDNIPMRFGGAFGPLNADGHIYSDGTDWIFNAYLSSSASMRIRRAGADRLIISQYGIELANSVAFCAAPTAGGYIPFNAWDSAGAYYEVARLQGATNSYFQFGTSGQNKFYRSGAITIGGDITMGDEKVMDTGTAVDDYFELRGYDTTGSARRSAIRIANSTTTTCKIGLFGATPVTRPSVEAAHTYINDWAVEGAAVVALINSLRTALVNLGAVA